LDLEWIFYFLFLLSFSVIRKGSHGNFVLSTAYYSTVMHAVFLSVLNCVVLEQSSVN